MNSSGFTLIELVIVLILVGIIAAVIAPMVNTDTARVPPAADIVASDIQYTQLVAISNNTSACITIPAVAGTTYGYPSSDYTGTYAAGACTLVTGVTQTRDLTPVGSNTTVAGQTIAFNSLGEPYGLTIPATITVANGASVKSIVVSPYTGKVTIQ